MQRNFRKMTIYGHLDRVIKGQFYKGITGKLPFYGYFEVCNKATILQRNYMKMPILWSFSYNSFVKFQGKGIWEPLHGHIISKIHVIMRRVIMGLHYICLCRNVPFLTLLLSFDSPANNVQVKIHIQNVIIFSCDIPTYVDSKKMLNM